MNCPKCNGEMELVVYQSVEVDRCKSCKGIWFDLLEHEDLKSKMGSESIDIGDPKVGKEFNKISDVDCPRCHNKMIPMVDKKQPHIWYESCPTCYGIFFDAGEFKDFKEETLVDFFKDLFTDERR